MKKAPDELAHPEYWNIRYQTSITGRPRSPAFSIGDSDSVSSENETEDQIAEQAKRDLNTYDWFRNWEHLETWIKQILPASETCPKILHLGCGNSVCF